MSTTTTTSAQPDQAFGRNPDRIRQDLHQLDLLPRYIRPRRGPRPHWAEGVGRRAGRSWARRHPIRALAAMWRARATRRALQRGEATLQGPHPLELIWLPGDRQAERESLRLTEERLARFGLDQFDRWGGIERLIEEFDEEWNPPPRPPLPWPWEGWWR